MNPKKSFIGLKLYIIALLFTTLSIFLQVIPIDSAKHFQDKLLISSSDFVYLSSLFFISYSMMQLPGGILFDKYGLKYVLPISIIIASVSVILYWGSSSTWMVGASRVMAGLGCSVAYISGIYIAANFFQALDYLF